MAADEASEGTAVTIIQSMETEEEDPDGGVAVKVLDLPLVNPPVLKVNTERLLEDEAMELDTVPKKSTDDDSDLKAEDTEKVQEPSAHGDNGTSDKAGTGNKADDVDEAAEESSKPTEDESVVKAKKLDDDQELEMDATDNKVEDVEEAAEAQEAETKTSEDDEKLKPMPDLIENQNEDASSGKIMKGDSTSPIEIDKSDEEAEDVEMSEEIEEKLKPKLALSAPPLDDEDTIDSSGRAEDQSMEAETGVSVKSDTKDGDSSIKRVTRKSATKTPTPTPQSDPEDEQAKSEASVETADEANPESRKSDKHKSNKSSGVTSTDDEDGAQSTDNPSQSPRDRVSDASSSSPSKSFETSSEHMKMRGRLQKELRKLGIDTLDSKPDETNPEEEDKPAGRPSRNAARVAARKITNVVAKSNMTMESLAASDGEDYSGDGISTRLAAQKKAANRKKLTYVSGQKALINNDLMMDCMEEALAPCQIDAFRNAVHHYNTITNQIHQMQKRKLQVTFNNRPLTHQEYDLMMNSTKKDDDKYRLETATSKVCRGGWSLVTVQRLGTEQLRPNIVMTQSAPFADLPDEGENDMSRLEEEFAIHQLDTNPVPFLVKHKFLRPMIGTKSRHHACDCNADTDISPAESTLDGYVWKCSKCSRTWNIQRPEQTLFSWYAKIPLYKFLNVIKSWVLAHSCEETASLTGVDTFIVRSIWRSIQELCHKDVIRRILPLGASGDIVEVTAAHMDPFVVLAALDKKTNTFRAKVFPAVATSEVDLAKAASAWISKDSVIATKSSIMRTTFIEEQKFTKVPVLTETTTLDEFLLIHLSDHFGNFRLESSHKPILEGFLYEIQWRRAFGRFGPRESFWRMIAQLLPTSQEGMDFLAQVASQFVTPGGQVPLGVRQPLIERRNSNDDVVVIRDEEEETVILENYYYARRDGERHVQKHKKYMRDGEMFFRCPVCKKVAKNNISIMKHISMHLESNREFNPDVSHMCICRTCFRDFETPFDCQVHVQQVHLASPELERLCCKICSLGFKDEEQLVYHMKTTHTARDTPFVCKICHYRSSFKHHVLDHFREKHSGCNALQCPYCLEMYYCQAKQVVTGVQGTTKFYSHLFKHMNNTPKTCTQCSLPFIKQKELRAHKLECHNKNVVGKGKMTGCGWSSENPVIVNKPRKKPSSPPASEKKEEEPPENSADAKVNWLVPSLRLPEDVEDYDCRECQKPITQEHFCRVLRCTECHFFTCCQSSFTGHMLKQHAQRLSTIPRTIPTTPLLDNKRNLEKFVGRCKKCDEKFEDGNSLVKHLVLSCAASDGATIELGKRKAAMKHTQVKRRRGAEQEEEHKFEDVVGEPFTEVFNTSSSNSVGSTPIKTNVPKQAKGQKSGVSTDMVRFLNQLGLRNSSESCSQFKVSYAGPKCVKQQWISMGLVQQEIESSSESEDENEKPEKKEAREKARKERAMGLLPKTKENDEDHIGEADSPPSSSSSDSSVTDVDLD